MPEGECKLRTVGKEGGSFLIDLREESFESLGDLWRIRAVQKDLEAVTVVSAKLSGQVQNGAEGAENILGAAIVLSESQREESLGVVGDELEGIDHEASILTKQRACLLDLCRVDFGGGVTETVVEAAEQLAEPRELKADRAMGDLQSAAGRPSALVVFVQGAPEPGAFPACVTKKLERLSRAPCMPRRRS